MLSAIFSGSFAHCLTATVTSQGMETKHEEQKSSLDAASDKKKNEGQERSFSGEEEG